MEFRPLHKCQEYMKECAEVLNEEWKRSLSARLHSLEKSRDSFPICLVLLEEGPTGSGKSVVGHSRLSEVHGQPQKSCLIESVVVKKSLRGKGYGRVVMEKTEKFAASQGYTVMYLTTHDKQEFYKHLGYQFCSPIVTMAMDIIPDQLAKQLMGSLKMSGQIADESSIIQSKTSIPSDTNLNCSNNENKDTVSVDSSGRNEGTISSSPSLQLDVPPVPPPPPPPPPKTGVQPVPPPPPPLTKSAGQGSTDNKTVARWDPSKVSWMKKTL